MREVNDSDMYHVKITHKDEVIASTYQDLLSDSVDVANRLSYNGCKITVYESIKTLCGFEDTNTILSWVDDGFSTL